MWRLARAEDERLWVRECLQDVMQVAPQCTPARVLEAATEDTAFAAALLSAKALAERLLAQDGHQTDVGDAFHAATLTDQPTMSSTARVVRVHNCAHLN